MYELRLPTELQSLADKGTIDADDVTRLRRDVYPGGVSSPHEANAMFWLNECCADAGPEWSAYFVEAIADHIVNRQNPVGLVDDGNAAFLIRRIMSETRVVGVTEMELLVKIIETSEFVPETLRLLLLNEIKASVLEGAGPLRSGKPLTKGAIIATEVDLVKRSINGLASNSNVHITRNEAEVLFDLNEAIVGSEGHSEWTKLFVCAIANHVMSARTWEVSSQDVVAAEEGSDEGAALEDRDDVLGFMSRVAVSRLSDTLTALKTSAENAAAKQREMEARLAGAEMISHSEAEWLNQRIGRDGVMHDNEKALLNFIAQEAPEVHPSLKVLVASAA